MRKDKPGRVLVALDSTIDSKSTLQIAVELSRCLQSRLLGLFVEDINLFNLAALPFSQNVIDPSGISRSMNLRGLERSLQSMARNMEHTLQQVASQARIDWSFQVTRGYFFAELLSHAEQHDLLVITRQVKSNYLELAMTRDEKQLKAETQNTVAIVFDGSPAAEEALRIAAKNSRDINKPLRVLLPGNQPELQEKARTLLDPYGLEVEFENLANTDISTLATVANSRNSALLIIALETGGEHPEKYFEELATQLQCPLVVVR